MSSAQDITDLNALATKFDDFSGSIIATFSGTKDKLYNSSSGSAILGTGLGDTIGITISDAVSPNEWVAIKAKTGSTVTANGGFSAALSEYATGGNTTNNWDSAVAAPNAAKSVTITGTLGSGDIANFNAIAGDNDHGGSITASITAELSQIDPSTLASTNSDTITVVVSDELTATGATGIGGLNSLKAITNGVITATVTQSAANLATLDTTSTDVITLNATGTTSVDNAIAITAKTSSLDNISFANIIS